MCAGLDDLSCMEVLVEHMAAQMMHEMMTGGGSAPPAEAAPPKAAGTAGTASKAGLPPKAGLPQKAEPAAKAEAAPKAEPAAKAVAAPAPKAEPSASTPGEKGEGKGAQKGKKGGWDDGDETDNSQAGYHGWNTQWQSGGGGQQGRYTTWNWMIFSFINGTVFHMKWQYVA